MPSFPAAQLGIKPDAAYFSAAETATEKKTTWGLMIVVIG